MSAKVVIDAEQLESLRELNEPGEADLVTELIDIFFKQSPETIQALDAAVTKKDALQVEKMAHKLKGSCANLGAEHMRILCQKMEENGREKKLDGTVELLAGIKQAYSEVSEVLARDWRKSK